MPRQFPKFFLALALLIVTLCRCKEQPQTSDDAAITADLSESANDKNTPFRRVCDPAGAPLILDLKNTSVLDTKGFPGGNYPTGNFEPGVLPSSTVVELMGDKAKDGLYIKVKAHGRVGWIYNKQADPSKSKLCAAIYTLRRVCEAPNGLNVRNSNSQNAPKVGPDLLKNETHVRWYYHTDQDDDWQFVRIPTGEFGWVKSEFLCGPQPLRRNCGEKAYLHERNDGSSHKIMDVQTDQIVELVDMSLNNNWFKVRIKTGAGQGTIGWMGPNHLCSSLDREQSMATASSDGSVQCPSKARITTGYGWRIHPIKGYKQFHDAIDLGCFGGDPLASPITGTIRYVPSAGGCGNMVEVENSTYLTRLCHCSVFGGYKNGQQVNKGAVIAKCGDTGTSSGPHVHFVLRKNGTSVNPQAVAKGNCPF